MGFSELVIKGSYTGKGERLLNDFLLPVLSVSKKYDRITGYYTIESLLAISQGIESLFNCGGKMRLIIGVHNFPVELVEATLRRDYLREQIDLIRVEISKEISTISDSLSKKQLATIAWMIEDRLLEVKAASVKGCGIFHPKTLLFSDQEGRKVAAVGSSNETGSGLGGNFEQLMVAKSWEQPEAVADQETFFESLWNNEELDAITLDISEDTVEMILGALGREYCNPNHSNKMTVESEDIIYDAAMMPANFFVSGNVPALFMHQERAVIDALSRWPVRVLFADEVGLGKTFEAAATLQFLVKYCKVKRVIVLTPKSVLKQWQDELYEHFGLCMWLYDSSTREYISPEGNILTMNGKNPVGPTSPDLILMSAQYARGSGEAGSVFERDDCILPDLLIVDEAHSARVSKSLNGGKKKTRMYEVLEKISTKIPHIILATATPMQKDAEEYHAVLKLLGLPKIWNKERLYNLSLKLINKNTISDLSDASSAADLLYATVINLSPDTSKLTDEQKIYLNNLLQIYCTEDKYNVGIYVKDNWSQFRQIFIRLHPARLLTIRNTRRALTELGYIFPKRNLIEIPVTNSDKVRLFYERVKEYLNSDCFSIESVMNPEKTRNIGFVRISYQQRVASSLYSCIQSLKRRLTTALSVRNYLASNGYIDDTIIRNLNEIYEIEDIDDDVLIYDDYELDIGDSDTEIDVRELSRAVSIECTSLNTLINQAERLLEESGDMKIEQSIKQALTCLDNGDSVLVFSRYTDTVEGLIEEFKKHNTESLIDYAVYTGKQSTIVYDGKEEMCDKNRIKQELFAGKLKIIFCSDAASEGLNLQAARVLINVDVPWTPSRLEQRIGRIARLGQTANEVDIYNIWYPDSIEAEMYHRIQRRLEETNLAIGEFPEVVAISIKKSVLDGDVHDDKNMKELMDIRNSYQTQALEELWHSKEVKESTSDLVRKQLIDICDRNLVKSDHSIDSKITKYILPNRTEIRLTASSGMQESISLKSDVWKFIKIKIPKVGVVADTNGVQSAFVYNSKTNIIKHEKVLEMIKTNIDENMLLKERPKMLPNPNALRLNFASCVDVNPVPEFWKDEEERNENKAFGSTLGSTQIN